MTLQPTTKRLKQLIREHGARGWEVIFTQRVACFGGDLGLFVCSPDNKHTRWVRPGDVREETE